MTTDHDINLSVYSDMFKDVHGFRPRNPEVRTWSEARLDAEMNKLQADIDRQLADELEDADEDAWKKYV